MDDEEELRRKLLERWGPLLERLAKTDIGICPHAFPELPSDDIKAGEVVGDGLCREDTDMFKVRTENNE